MLFASESHFFAQNDRGGIFCAKNLGDAYASPVCCFADTSLSASFSSLPFSWLPWFYSPFPFFMDLLSNGRLLQLIECIESIKSDVKKKMMLARACDR
jgi:hypothetical protein